MGNVEDPRACFDHGSCRRCHRRRRATCHRPPPGRARARAMVWGTTEAEATYTPQSINQPTYKLRKRLETSKAYGRLSISGSQKVSSVDGRWPIEL
jgi:hypothetical protein